MKLNSIIFHTSRLAELRDFYEGVLGLPTGTYVKNGEAVNDYDNNYVNYHLNGGLLCFEYESGRTDSGTIILNVADFRQMRERLESNGIKILAGNERYLKIKDPEGRSLIFEPTPS